MNDLCVDWTMVDGPYEMKNCYEKLIEKKKLRKPFLSMSLVPP